MYITHSGFLSFKSFERNLFIIYMSRFLQNQFSIMDSTQWCKISFHSINAVISTFQFLHQFHVVPNLQNKLYSKKILHRCNQLPALRHMTPKYSPTVELSEFVEDDFLLSAALCFMFLLLTVFSMPVLLGWRLLTSNRPAAADESGLPSGSATLWSSIIEDFF